MNKKEFLDYLYSKGFFIEKEKPISICNYEKKLGCVPFVVGLNYEWDLIVKTISTIVLFKKGTEMNEGQHLIIFF